MPENFNLKQHLDRGLGESLHSPGKGSYVGKKLEELDANKEVLFKLDDDETPVIYNNVLSTLGQSVMTL